MGHISIQYRTSSIQYGTYLIAVWDISHYNMGNLSLQYGTSLITIWEISHYSMGHLSLKHDGTVPMFLHQSRCRISPYYLNIISHKVSYILESLVYKETHECTRQWWGLIRALHVWGEIVLTHTGFSKLMVFNRRKEWAQFNWEQRNIFTVPQLFWSFCLHL